MTRRPNRDSLRAKLLAEFAENPAALLTRQEIIDRHGVSGNAVDHIIWKLKRDGVVTTLFGPGRIAFYALVTLPAEKEAAARKKRADQPVRRWPSSSSYVPPRPIPISIFEWRP